MSNGGAAAGGDSPVLKGSPVFSAVTPPTIPTAATVITSSPAANAAFPLEREWVLWAVNPIEAGAVGSDDKQQKSSTTGAAAAGSPSTASTATGASSAGTAAADAKSPPSTASGASSASGESTAGTVNGSHGTSGGYTYLRVGSFRTVTEFWCMFNHLDFVAERIGEHTSLLLLSESVHVLPHLYVPAQQWDVKVSDARNVKGWFIDLALMLIGELFDTNQHIVTSTTAASDELRSADPSGCVVAARSQTGVAYRPHGEGTKQAEPIDLISILSATASNLPTGDLALASQVQHMLGLPLTAPTEPSSLLFTQKFVNPHKIKAPTHKSGSGTFDLNFLRSCAAEPAAAILPSQLPSLDWALFAPKPTPPVAGAGANTAPPIVKPRNPLSASNSPLGSGTRTPTTPHTPKTSGFDETGVRRSGGELNGKSTDIGEGVLLLNEMKSKELPPASVPADKTPPSATSTLPASQSLRAGGHKAGGHKAASAGGGGGSRRDEMKKTVATDADIKKLLAHYLDTYTADLTLELNAGLKSILQTEGCAMCLRRDVPKRGGGDAKQGESEDDSYSGPYVVLCCKLLHCQHVLHLPCLATVLGPSNGAAPIQILRRFHPTSFSRAIPYKCNPDGKDIDSNTLPNARDALGTQHISIDFDLTHLLSNVKVLSLRLPHAVRTQVDSRSGAEYGMIRLSQTHAVTPNSAASSTASAASSATSAPSAASAASAATPKSAGPASSSAGTTTITTTAQAQAQPAASASAAPAPTATTPNASAATGSGFFSSFTSAVNPSFDVERGEMIITVTNQTTLLSHSIAVNFDLTTALDGNNGTIKLIALDPLTRHVATIGVQVNRREDRTNPNLYSLLYIKYEFASPNYPPPQQLADPAPVPLVPVLPRELLLRAASGSARHVRANSLTRTPIPLTNPPPGAAAGGAAGGAALMHPGVAAHQHARGGGRGSPRLHSSTLATGSPIQSDFSPISANYSPSPVASPVFGNSPPHSPGVVAPFPITGAMMHHNSSSVHIYHASPPTSARQLVPAPSILLPQTQPQPQMQSVAPFLQPAAGTGTGRAPLSVQQPIIPAVLPPAAAQAAAAAGARAGSTSAYAQRRPPLTVKSPLPVVPTDPQSMQQPPQSMQPLVPSGRLPSPNAEGGRPPFVPSLPLSQLTSQPPPDGFNPFARNKAPSPTLTAITQKPPSPRTVQPPMPGSRTSPRDQYGNPIPQSQPQSQQFYAPQQSHPQQHQPMSYPPQQRDQFGNPFPPQHQHQHQPPQQFGAPPPQSQSQPPRPYYPPQQPSGYNSNEPLTPDYEPNSPNNFAYSQHQPPHMQPQHHQQPPPQQQQRYQPPQQQSPYGAPQQSPQQPYYQPPPPQYQSGGQPQQSQYLPKGQQLSPQQQPQYGGQQPPKYQHPPAPQLQPHPQQMHQPKPQSMMGGNPNAASSYGPNSNSFAPSFTSSSPALGANVSSSQQPPSGSAFPLWGSTAYSAPFASSSTASTTAAGQPSYSSVNLNAGRAPSPHQHPPQVQSSQYQSSQGHQQFGGFEKTNSKFDMSGKSNSGASAASVASAASFAKEAWDDPSLAAFEDTRIESPPPTQADRLEDEDDGKYNDKYSTNKDEFEDGDAQFVSNYRSGSPDVAFQIDDSKIAQTNNTLQVQTLAPVVNPASHLNPALGPSPAVALNLTKEQVIGQVVRLAKSHSGSRFVQQKLEAADAAFFPVFLAEMQENLASLMVDNFGHFAIEKLIARCTDDQRLGLLKKLAPHIAAVACQKHGSFSVQALMDTLHTPAQIVVLCAALARDIVKIMTHSSGHFVVLRFLQRFPYAATKFVDDAIVNNCLQIGTDHHGLRVVKAVVGSRRVTELPRLFKQVARLTMKLVENQYGNYVVQSVLDVAPAGVRTNIKVKMEGKYMRLSKQKFSSNVVEKCLKQSSTHWRSVLIRELIAQPAVSDLLRDRYGNYVLQTALAVATPNQVSDIMESINPHLSSLRENVRGKWKKMLKKALSRV